jgi:transmembrane sensor
MNMQENQKEYLNELIIKFLSGDVSSDEMTSLKNMLHGNEKNQQLLHDIKEAWDTSSLYVSDVMQINTKTSWEKVQTAINERASERVNAIPGKVLRIAALWLLLISAGSVATWVFMKNKVHYLPKGTCQIQTPLGSRSHTILPDGTEVWLNAATTLQYPESFSANQRDVYLSGEAFFKVKTNKNRPFIVHTSDVKIKALGTTFNVKAYPADKSVVTTLVEGIVKLENEQSQKNNFTYTLKPKEKLTFFKTQEQQTNTSTKLSKPTIEENASTEKPLDNIEIKENINTIFSTSWKDPRWVIDGEQLDNLAISLERRFGVKINVLSPELSAYKFTGTIENETLEQVLKYLKLTTPIKYSVEKGYVDLTINEALIDKYTKYLKKAN